MSGNSLRVALLLIWCVPSSLEADDWPQWRGPTRDGQCPAPTWPAGLKADQLRLQWRVELGPGYSGPIVVGSRVFVTETVDKAVEMIRALDRATGKQVWQAGWPGALSVPFFAKANGDWIRATPACDGECLYVAGMRDVLACLDSATGAVRWRLDFVEQLKTPLPSFGFVSSPLVDGEHLYVQAGAAVVKVDKRTGKIIWRSAIDDGGMMGSAFSSPIVATICGRRQVVAQTRSRLLGLDTSSGDILWAQEVPAFRGMNILTPTVFQDGLFTSTYGGKTFFYRVQEGQAGFQVETAWTDGAQGYMSTPVIHDGHAYVHMKNQRFACFDLQTGERKWTSKPFGEYWSLVAQGDRILALDERGELLLIRAQPREFELLDTRKVSDAATWGHLAVAGRELFVRELNAVTCWAWEN